MGRCPSIEACGFFNDRLKVLPGLTELLKEQFCKGDFERCARYRVSKAAGRESVPNDLYPSQEHRVAAILAKAGRGPA